MPSLTTTINLDRRRGDTKAFQFTIDEDGADLDITGHTFLMTVNVDVDPTDPPVTPDEWQLTASLVAPNTDGKFKFQPSAPNMDLEPGVFFYDIQMTDPGGEITTVIAGTLTITQDITK